MILIVDLSELDKDTAWKNSFDMTNSQLLTIAVNNKCNGNDDGKDCDDYKGCVHVQDLEVESAHKWLYLLAWFYLGTHCEVAQIQVTCLTNDNSKLHK